MFSYEHRIWKVASNMEELDDWLPYAEELIQKWATQSCDEVDLSGFDLQLASLLLEDNLLPASARVAFARLMLAVVREANANRLTLECLDIKPPRPGRKQTDRRETGYRLVRVHELINSEGIAPTLAYDIVAKECFKSPDTIRREYERAMKRRGDQESEPEN